MGVVIAGGFFENMLRVRLGTSFPNMGLFLAEMWKFAQIIKFKVEHKKEGVNLKCEPNPRAPSLTRRHAQDNYVTISKKYANYSP